jgi:signal transduction histidine kinase/DNA-binding response OmpR family regulator
MSKDKYCWEKSRCNNQECAAFGNPAFPDTPTAADTIPEIPYEKLLFCIDCDEFMASREKGELTALLKLTSRSIKQNRLKNTKNNVEKLGWELSIGFSDCFEMLKKLSLGDPTARVVINTDNWLLKKLETALNNAGESIERFISQTHEMAIGVCEHYATLSRLASGDRSARASEDSGNELIAKLGTLINKEAASFTQKIKEGEDLNSQLEKGLTELREANEKLKSLDKQKSDFLSMVSHELRTPLTSILGFAKIINKKFANIILPGLGDQNQTLQAAIKQIHQNINIIVSEGDRLTALINNVLDLAKIEAGRIDLHFIPTSPVEVVEQSIRAISVIYENKGITIKKEIQAGVPVIHADKDRLVQVMINLLSNAAKFTERGEVSCSVTHNVKSVTVSVTDTGMGIPDGKLKHIFNRFEQGGETLTSKPQGSGLGLAICKHIIESHSGTIWAESRKGGGSVFSFTIPVKSEVSMGISSIDHEVSEIVKQLKDHVSIIHPRRDRGKRLVMIIDDDAHIRELLRQELEADGYTIMESEDGLDAIQKLQKTKPHLIILDIMMPKINGYDTAAVIRNNPDTRDIPIIILSILEDARRGYRLGVDRYFTKPVDTKSLLAEIKRLITQGETLKKILIIDQSESTVKSLAEALQAKGYTVGKAYSGKQAVTMARKMKPNLIILDALLKERNEITRTIRFEKGMENVCFILLGVHDDKEKNPDR